MADTVKKANGSKKKRRRLRRSVRKTLGALFLATALVVAAIPVDGLQAEEGDAGAEGSTTTSTNWTRTGLKKVTLVLDKDKTGDPNESVSNIPDFKVDDGTIIYTTGNGQFQFAYANTPASGNKNVAIILGYQKGGSLPGGALTIPEYVDAYRNFSADTSQGNYVAVNGNSWFLYYLNEWEEESGNFVKDEEGNPTDVPEMVTKTMMAPCYATSEEVWKDKQLYYHMVDGENKEPGTDKPAVLTEKAEEGQFKPILSSDPLNLQRIHDAEVWYIGNQYLKSSDGNWEIAGDIINPSDGIFAQVGNIKTLTLQGDKLCGVGNYAFYNCTSLESITLNNGLDTLGNYAFADCINIRNINIDPLANLVVIGDHAFYQCRALESFTAPTALQKIGDSAFEGCRSMTSINLIPDNKNVALSQLGYDVFKDCEALQGITFPRDFSDNGLLVSTFAGCSSLKFIKTTNSYLNLVDDKGFDLAVNYSIEDFKAILPEDFYLAGIMNSDLHKTATNSAIAFCYYDGTKNVYELTVLDENKKPVAIYRVDESNQLVYCWIDQTVENVELPPTIGPYKVQEIDEYTFQNNCFLRAITIPASITSIAPNAFRGCHQLKNVTFADPSNLTIGAGAFQTQATSGHNSGCSNPTPDKQPVLNFIGPIYEGCAAFEYAMNPGNRINVGTQDETYITYYSGWPSSLKVQYNSATDKNTLLDYPTLHDLEEYETATDLPAYITEDYKTAATRAVKKYYGTYTPTNPSDPNDTTSMTDYEKEIVNAALNIVLPKGIEAIQDELFSEKEKQDVSTPGRDISKTLTAEGIQEVASRAFAGCANMTAINLGGETKTIGDYAFDNCDKLTSVSIPATVETLGLSPFINCDILGNVNFNGNAKYSCKDGLIFETLETDEDGNKTTKLVEYLSGRSSTNVKAEDLEGVKEISESAFEGSNVLMVDLSGSGVTDIPRNAFAETKSLVSVAVPSQSVSIGEHAFLNSNIKFLQKIPDTLTVIHTNAFENVPAVEFECVEGSAAQKYADTFNNITWTPYIPPVYYKVIFMMEDENGVWTTLKEESVLAGEDATPPEVEVKEGYEIVWNGPYPYTDVMHDSTLTLEYRGIMFTVTFLDASNEEYRVERQVSYGQDAEPPQDPVRDGYVFTGWYPSIEKVTKSFETFAQYDKADATITVRFLDHDGTVLIVRKVVPGEDADPPKDPEREGYTFLGWSGEFTKVTKDIDVYATYEKIDSSETRLTVRFLDWDDTVLRSVLVFPGEDATPPADPTREGYTFTGWRNSYTAVTEDVDVYATYEKIDSSETRLTVRFIDWDDTVLKSALVFPGEDATPPADPTREGYVFTGWRNSYTAVTEDVDVYAQYERESGPSLQYTVSFIDYDDTVLHTQKVNAGEDAIIPRDPVREGYTFTGWRPAPEKVSKDMETYAQYERTSSGDNNNDDNNNNGNNNNNNNNTGSSNGTGSGNSSVSLHTLMVRNGSGSGSYATGTQIIISANNPAYGQVFSGWTVSPSDTVVTDTKLSTVVVSMPDHDVALVANYVTGSGNTSSTNPNNRPSGGGTVSNGNTSVVIDKNGLSNTGVVSATVNGSSDNFTIKVSESTDATEAAVKALLAEFGSLDNIKYVPMDISLYDSTGTRKITDTTGLQITVTLPIPDSLISYAGNNKVAGVVNDRLDKRAVKFTTINGVSCVTFTAEHFSPYVIYVDTGKMESSGTVSDSTPKTGDGIHPKWFLSIGLASLSFVMFMQKDGGKNRKKQKVAVRARSH